MQKTIFFFISFLFLFTQTLYAQVVEESEDDTLAKAYDPGYKNKLTVLGGISFFALKDQAVSSFAYRAGDLSDLDFSHTTTPIMVSLDNIGHKFNHSLNFSTNKGSLVAAEAVGFEYIDRGGGGYKNNALDFNHIELNYALGYRLEKISTPQTEYYVGGTINFQNLNRKGLFLGTYINTYNDQYASLGVNWGMTSKFDEIQAFNLALYVPVLNYTDRYIASEHFTNVTSINKFAGIRAQLGYELTLALRWALVVNYKFNYTRFTEPDKIQMGIHFFMAGLSFRIN